MKNWAWAALLVVGCGSGVTGATGAAACITASACGIISNNTSVCTQTIEYLNDPAAEADLHVDAQQVNCIATAGSNCDAARACLNYNRAAQPCSGSSAMCDGSDLVLCDRYTGVNGANGTRRFHCGELGAGGTCVVGAPQLGIATVDCGYASCSPDSATCLDNNTLQTCAGGILRKTDCSVHGATCIPGTLARCGGAGPGCTRRSALDNTVGCDGNFLVTCGLDQREGRYDCGRDNLKCLPTFAVNGATPAVAYGCYLGNECDPSVYMASCTGNTLDFCNNGKKWKIDCTKFGFNQCDPSGGGRCAKS